MPWRSLAANVPAPWELTNLGSVPFEADLFRVSHTWSTQFEWPGEGALSIYESFDGNRAAGRRSYPSREPRLIKLRTPNYALAIGFAVREISIRRSLYARIFSDADWRVTVEVWEPDLSEFEPARATLDGGVF